MTTAKPPTCEHCGAPLDGKTPFCGSCGKAVPAGGGLHKQTMFGMPQVLAPVRGSLAPAPVASVPAKGPDEGESEQRERNTEAGVVVPPRGQMGRTMLGVVPVVQPPPPSTPDPPRGDSQRPGKAVRTKFGLGTVESPLPPAAPGGTANPAIPTTAPVLGKTMFGTADGLVAPPAAPPAGTSSAATSSAAASSAAAT